MFCWRNFLWLTVGGSPGVILTASQACYALFSECDPHAPAWSSSTSRSPLSALLSGRNPQLIKTFILFPILLSWCCAGPLAISLIDISLCLHSCVRSHASEYECEGAPGKVCELPLKHGALPPPGVTHTFIKWPLAFPCQAPDKPTLWGSRMFSLVQTSVAGYGWCFY